MATFQGSRLEGIRFTGTWILDELKGSIQLPNSPVHATPCDDPVSEMSDVEIIPQPKKMRTCAIDGVSELCTSWIGQNGICDISNSLAVERCKSEIKDLKKALKTVATECSKAFVAAGMMESVHPQVSKAVHLCSSYTSSANKKAVMPSSAIATVWKERTSDQALCVSSDRKEIAIATIGRKLVDTLTEEQHDPPDVSRLWD